MRQRFISYLFFFGLILVLKNGMGFGDKENVNTSKVDATENYTKPSLPPKPIKAPKVPTVPVPASAVNPSITEIQKELQSIVQIHRSLQLQHQAQIAEIQKITEQAKAHQKLLKSLSVPVPQVPKAPSSNIDEIIRVEKIRLIQEQAFKNRAMLEKIREQSLQEKHEKLAQALETKEAAPSEEKSSKGKGAKKTAPAPKEEPEKKRSWW